MDDIMDSLGNFLKEWYSKVVDILSFKQISIMSFGIGIIIFFIGIFAGITSKTPQYQGINLVIFSAMAGLSTAVITTMALGLYNICRKRSKLAATVVPFILYSDYASDCLYLCICLMSRMI